MLCVGWWASWDARWTILFISLFPWDAMNFLGEAELCCCGWAALCRLPKAIGLKSGLIRIAFFNY